MRSLKAVTKTVYRVNPIIIRMFELEIKPFCISFFSEMMIRPNMARPIRALAFNGSPPSSKFISAIVIVKNKTAMTSGLATSRYRNIMPASMITMLNSKGFV
jgi:hypothetical protein